MNHWIFDIFKPRYCLVVEPIKMPSEESVLYMLGKLEPGQKVRLWDTKLAVVRVPVKRKLTTNFKRFYGTVYSAEHNKGNFTIFTSRLGMFLIYGIGSTYSHNVKNSTSFEQAYK